MDIKSFIGKVGDVLDTSDAILEKSYENDKVDTLEYINSAVLSQATFSLMQGGTKERLLASTLFVVPSKKHAIRNLISLGLTVASIRRLGYKKAVIQNCIVCLPAYGRMIMRTFETI